MRANQFTLCFLYTPGLLFVVLTLKLTAVEAQTDLTTQPNATGCDVAKATIAKIESILSIGFQQGLFFEFKDTNFLLTRVAYLTSFGERSFYDEGSGMWQMTTQHLNQAKNSITIPVDGRVIQSELGFRFAEATESDIYRPIYNALTAVILMQNMWTSREIPERLNATGQWDYWKELTGVQDNTGSLEAEYIDKSQILDDNNGDFGTECFKCVDPPTDAVFVLDKSGSINPSEWEQQITFVKVVMSRFNVSMSVGATKVAFSIFDHSLADSRDFSTDLAASIKYLDDYTKTTGGTNLDEGLKEAARFMEQSSYSRINDTSVRKFIFFLTDGVGTLTNSTIERLRELPTVVYSIGLADAVDESKMIQVASSPDFVRFYSSLDDFEADVASILYDTCVINTFVVGQDNQTQYVIPALLLEERRYLTLQVENGKALKLDLTTFEDNNKFVVFFSCTSQFPNEADYDYKAEIDSTGKTGSFSIYVVCPYDPDADTLNEDTKRDTSGGIRRFRRSASLTGTTVSPGDGGSDSNATTYTDVGATFIWSETANNCTSSCSADLSFNQSTEQLSVIAELAALIREQRDGSVIDHVQDTFADTIQLDDEDDFLVLAVIVLGCIVGLLFIIAVCCICFRTWVANKESRTVGIYPELENKPFVI